MEQHKVLLLNASYEPLHVCTWRRAIILLLKGKAVIEVESPHSPAHKANSPHSLALPLVIRLQYYVRLPRKTIPLTRKNLMHRDRYTCQYCTKSGSDMTIDHIIPKSRGGRDEWENVVVACHHCNVKKGSRTPDEANMPLRCRPIRPINCVSFEVSKHNHMPQNAIEEWQKYMYGT